MSFVYGTIPILIIGFSQLLFGFNESLRIFGSFIVWHFLDNGEFTGVFYNRNICAAWFAAIFPFFAAAILSQVHANENIFKKVVGLLALFSVSLAMVLTNSRNAIGSLFFGSLFMIADFFRINQSIRTSKISKFSIALIMLVVVSSFSISFGLLNSVVDVLNQFFANENRFVIWRFGILVASKNLIIGSGPGGFTGYVSLLSPFDEPFYHVHSLLLDIWLSYGFLASAVFLVYVFYWLFISIRSGILRESLFNKAWVVAFVLLMIIHVTDLPYLDARINLVGWILFAGIVSYAESSALAFADESNDPLK